MTTQRKDDDMIDELVVLARTFAHDAKDEPITFKRLMKDLGKDFDRVHREGMFEGFLAGWRACEEARKPRNRETNE